MDDMTTIIRILTAALIMVTSNVTAQDFQGVATYKSHRKVDFKVSNDDGKQEDLKMQENIQAQLQKQFQQEYTLTFTKDESIYKKVEQLDKPNPKPSTGIVITVSEGSDVLYKNIKEDRYANKTELYGKLFLVKDTLQKPDWQLGSETKNIGDYTCFKATYTEEVESLTLSDEGEQVTEKIERNVTAWYTPQIPVNNGPQNFQGLPGLILEINDGKLTLVCSKIVMNPKERIGIKEPKKGKEVNEKKFREISDKKQKEMMERFRSSRRDGSSKVITIRG